MRDNNPKLFDDNSPEELNQDIYDLYEEGILQPFKEFPRDEFDTFFTIMKQTNRVEKDRKIWFKRTAFTAYGINHDSLVERIMNKLSIMEQATWDEEEFKPIYTIYILPIEEDAKFLVFMESNMPCIYHKNLLEKCFRTKFFVTFPHCQCHSK